MEIMGDRRRRAWAFPPRRCCQHDNAISAFESTHSNARIPSRGLSGRTRAASRIPHGDPFNFGRLIPWVRPPGARACPSGKTQRTRHIRTVPLGAISGLQPLHEFHWDMPPRNGGGAGRPSDRRLGVCEAPYPEGTVVKVMILRAASEHLQEGHRFCEGQSSSVGTISTTHFSRISIQWC